MAQADTPADEQTPYGTTETPPSIQWRLSNSAPTDAFVDFVRRKKTEYKGRDGRGQQQHYVPLPELLSYWTNARIREACQSYSEGITTRHDLIRSRFLRVFSTLVYIGKLSYIPAFQQNGLCDQRFPDTTLPGSWIQSPSHGSMFDDFKAHQWTFFPVILNRDALENTSLPPERILPLSSEETIRSQSHIDRAAIAKVRFHPSCNDLVESHDTPASNPFYILKTYHGQHHEQHYRHEAQAFARLPHDPLSTDHVVKCHAAFQHGETYNLVMEWVAGGDLLQFFQKRPPPRSFEDIIDFWDSLAKLNVGLHRIHQMILPGESTHQYQLVHQDIKPDNILLEIRSPSRPYQFSPIIADLGHSHIRHIRGDTSDIPAVDRRGNQIYCAPESSHHSGFRRIGPNGIKWDADIFSAGAVFSDAASWVAEGEDGRKEYSRRRREELENIKGFANSGYEIAFHNGSERLACVDAMHRDIRTKLPSHDDMTPRVLDIIEDHMMVLPKARLQAALLYSKFEKEIQDVKSGPKLPIRNRSQSTKPIHVPESHCALHEPETPPPSSKANRIFTPQGSPALSTSSTDGAWDCEEISTPTRSPRSPTHIAPLGALASPNPKRPSLPIRRPFTTPNPPPSAEHIHQVSDNAPRSLSETGSLLSMQDAADYRKAKKMGGRVNPRVEKDIEKLISNLEKRDHLFLIDDTESMKQHSDQVEEAFRTLAYIAKRIDPDHLELSFVSQPHHISKNRHTSGLITELRQHLSKHVSVTGRIESSLSTLITDRIMRRLPHFFPVVGHFPRSKPITIFVFTDGKWGEGVQPGSGLTVPINNLMQEMKSRGLNRTHVMFQFLRFGDDVEGMKHLAHLDDFGKKEKWDIVDTRAIGGDVSHMFLAALTEYHDNHNDSSSTDAE